MISARDSHGQSNVKNDAVPGLIADRVAFENKSHNLQGFNTVEGDFVVLSYYKKVAVLNRDGSVWWTKQHVFDTHRKLIQKALALTIV